MSGEFRTAPDRVAVPTVLWLRFVVMVAAVLAVTADLAGLLAEIVPRVPTAAVGSHCWVVLLDALGDGPQPLPPTSSPDWAQKYVALVDANPECYRPPNPLPVSPKLAAVGLVAMVCLVTYLLAPSWRVFRRGLVPVDSLPGIRAEVDELAGAAGVRVYFVADLLNPTIGGLAFGRVGRRYVVLNRGLLMLAAADRPAFRMIVRHELAHVQNKDLDVTYLTVVLWRVFLGVVSLPTLILFHSALGSASLSVLGLFEFWLELAALGVVVLLIHHDILRERELRADARATAWSGDSAVLLRVLDRAATEATEATGVTGATAAIGEGNRVRREAPMHRLLRSLRHMLQVHPGPDARRQAVLEPAAALPSRAGQGFVLGLVIGLTWLSMLLDFFPPLQAIGLIPRGMLLPQAAVPDLVVVAAPVGLVLGLAVWQAVIAGRGAGRRVRVNRLALAVGSGLVIGDTITGQSSLLGPDLFALTLSERAVWWGLVLVGVWLFALWSAVCALVWRSVPFRGRPAAAAIAGSLLGAALFGFWLPWVLSLRVDEPISPANGYLSPGAFLGEAMRSFGAQVSAWPGDLASATLLVLVAAFLLVGVLRRCASWTRSRKGGAGS